MARLTRLIPVLIATCCCAAIAKADAPILLRYQFQPGQVVQYDDVLSDEYRIQLGEEVDHPSTKQNARKSYQVISVGADGSAVVRLVFNHIQSEIFQNGERFKFDSRTDQIPDYPFAGMKSIIGQPHLELTVSTTGEVSGIKKLLGTEESTEQVQQAALDMLVRLPREPVSVGSTWREDFEVGVKIPESQLSRMAKMQRRFTIRSIENGQVTIDIVTKTLTPLDHPDEQLQMLRRTPQGFVVLDMNTGLMVRRQMSQDNMVTGFGKTQSVINFKQNRDETLVVQQAAAN